MIPAAGGKIAPAGFNVRCPSCGRWPYLGINTRLLYANAWCCGYFPLARALARLSGRSESDLKTLIGDAGKGREEKVEHTGTLQLPYDLQPLTPLSQQYLRKRGFDPDLLGKLWGLQTVGMLGGRIKHRVFIPIHYRGRIVSWTTRNVTNQEPRYVSARDGESNIPIEDLLYGIDYVRHVAIIVEGPADCWRIGPGATALLGLRVSNRQLAQLAAIPLRVLALDAEPEAQHRAAQLAALLSPLPGKTLIVRLETGKDAGSAHQEEIDELRRRFL